MKINNLNKRLLFLTILMSTILMCLSMSFAAWWGTPGYEWALSNGLTGTKTKGQLDSTVELDDLYYTLIKYLQLKGVYPLNKNLGQEDKMDGMDNTAKSICDQINAKMQKEHFNIQDYYVVEKLTTEGYDLLEKYKGYSQRLTREDLKNIETYLRLSRYRAATLIEDRSDREYALGRVGYVKNSRIVNYGVIPYTGKISRKEFLKLVYGLMSTTTGPVGNSTAMGSSDYAITAFYNAGVLIGYDTGLELEQLLRYSELYSFLYRMEIYDFSTGTNKTVFSDIGAYIDDAYYGNITKNQLISYLQDLAENTNYKIDLVTRLNNELGDNWTVREAGEFLYEIYSTEGFTYVDGRTTITAKAK
ncbi:MAG: hypothetical protein IKI57_00590 [Clostridia bacterium]|nr:hypothetical protein [Clostridia bacterium]